jgi:hypothetical protein
MQPTGQGQHGAENHQVDSAYPGSSPGCERGQCVCRQVPNLQPFFIIASIAERFSFALFGFIAARLRKHPSAVVLKAVHEK